MVAEQDVLIHVGQRSGQLEGMLLKTAPDAIVLACNVVAAAKSTEDIEEEAPSTPEVITEKAESEGGGTKES